MSELFLHLFFLFCLGRYAACQDPVVIADGKRATILCDFPSSLKSPVLWFRVGNTGMDVLGFITSGTPELAPGNTVIISREKIEIKEFNKQRDSGVYGCSTTSDKTLLFGRTTILAGPPDPTTSTTALVVTTAPPPNTTARPCPCKTLKTQDSSGSCEVAILAPLVVGCTLFLLLLILTVRHCSRVRTRGCPHHHKRRPRNATQANAAQTGRDTRPPNL